MTIVEKFNKLNTREAQIKKKRKPSEFIDEQTGKDYGTWQSEDLSVEMAKRITENIENLDYTGLIDMYKMLYNDDVLVRSFESKVNI